MLSVLSCAGDKPVFLSKEGEKIKLYKTEKDSSVIYSFKNSSKPAPYDTETLFKADIGGIENSFTFRILLDKEDKVLDVSAVKGETGALYFRIPTGHSIEGFVLENKVKSDNLPAVEKIDMIDSSDFFSGMKHENGKLFRSDTVLLEKVSGQDTYKYSVFSGSSMCTEITADFDYLNRIRETVKIVLIGKLGERIAYNYFPLHGENSIVLNSRLFGFLPSSVEISSAEGNLQLRNLYANSDFCSKYENDLSLPVKAGFGLILHADRESWRNDEYELYSWNYFPDFLIIDTIDYSFQAKMFKRLAFYVEKPGSRGVIRTNEEIENLHGWNAHDYKAADLASFFNETEKLDFPLNREEELLEKILLKNNVIKKEGEVYAAGNGGILSVSRESSGYLRRIFITHEGYHGVFFSSPEFRKRCEVIWDEVEPEMKEFWKLFFEYKRYDTEDHYLLVNEFMAYNLQQPLDRVIPYYFGHIIPRLIDRYPEKKEFLNMILDNKENQFLSDAEKLAFALDDVTSMPAGSLILLNRERS